MESRTDPTKLARAEAFMAITYSQAEAKLHEWTENPALRNHARAVEAAMRRAAHHYGGGDQDEPRWAITGLLHDVIEDTGASLDEVKVLFGDEVARLVVRYVEQ